MFNQSRFGLFIRPRIPFGYEECFGDKAITRNLDHFNILGPELALREPRVSFWVYLILDLPKKVKTVTSMSMLMSDVNQAAPAQNFKTAIRSPRKINIIAEFKQVSPSKGIAPAQLRDYLSLANDLGLDCLVEVAAFAIEAGSDAIGMAFAPSRRQVTKDISWEICRIVPPFVSKVGVFVNEQEQKVQELDGRVWYFQCRASGPNFFYG